MMIMRIKPISPWPWQSEIIERVSIKVFTLDLNRMIDHMMDIRV